MDFNWSTEQQELKRAIIKFAKKDLEQDVVILDRESTFNSEGWRKCGDFGIHGLPVPEVYGGLGQDPLTTIYALENLGYVCKDNGLLFSINAHMWTCEMPILDFGTEEQKQQYLPRLCSGELIGGNAMSEPDSGSDAYSLRTTAEKKGDKYILNGNKIFVTNGPVADIIIVFATINRELGVKGITAFIVPKNFPGVSVGRKIEKMGIRTSPMAELFFENCEVPVENRLGKEGAGSALFTHAMTWERGFILASAVGAMQRQLEICIRYAKERKQFGQAIGKFQMIGTKITDMKIRLETSRALLYKVGWLRSQGKTAIMEAAMAKLHISESWVLSCQDAIQIHGGNGYTTEYEVERELRDAMGSRLYSGTSEIQRLIIAPLMGV
jgi:L-prolyl-PCP dehydrogenase